MDLNQEALGNTRLGRMVLKLINCLRSLVSFTLKAPLQTRGFHAGAAAYPGGDPSYIISCSNNLRCPGELALGECPPNAFGIACIACMPGYFDSEGLCQSCSESRPAAETVKPWVLRIVVGSTGWSKHPSLDLCLL